MIILAQFNCISNSTVTTLTLFIKKVESMSVRHVDTHRDKSSNFELITNYDNNHSSQQNSYENRYNLSTINFTDMGNSSSFPLPLLLDKTLSFLMQYYECDFSFAFSPLSFYIIEYTLHFVSFKR